MSKIICDICGTTYQDTAPRCPICGCSRDAAAGLLGEDLLAAEPVQEESAGRSGKYTVKKKEIFDFDEVNSFEEEDETEEVSYESEDDDDDYDEEEPRHNTFVVILLTVLIVALLAVAGFLFVRYFLPNMKGEETVPPTTAETYVEPETTAAPTQLEIPCQNLALTSGTANLTQEGQYFLLHVIAMPEDTTDEILFASADESIATVTADGKITAVSEGETVIYITCGSSQLTCPVVCNFSGEIKPVETIAAENVVPTEPEETTADETVPAEEGETDETKPEETETAEDATEPTKTLAPGEVELKLKKTDIGLKVYYYVTLELDCELQPTDVEWSSEHPHIATVDENGVVTAKKDGVTDIIVKYGDQEVRCKVRCSY